MVNKIISEELVKEMVQNGVVLGHKRSKTHPKMKPFITGNRNEIEILNPAATWDSLESAINFLREKISKGGLILFVATKPAAKAVVKNFADEFKYPFVGRRWLGGTLTNFQVIRGRLSHFESLRDRKERGELLKYTKKEQRDFDKEIGKLSQNFLGLLPMKKVPDVLFVVDAEAHVTAIKEARILGIPVVAILDTNDDPSKISNPIYASDHSRQSVEWIMSQIKGAIKPLLPRGYVFHDARDAKVIKGNL